MATLLSLWDRLAKMNLHQIWNQDQDFSMDCVGSWCCRDDDGGGVCEFPLPFPLLLYSFITNAYFIQSFIHFNITYWIFDFIYTLAVLIGFNWIGFGLECALIAKCSKGHCPFVVRFFLLISFCFCSVHT